jgi:calcium-dependent protein kinase
VRAFCSTTNELANLPLYIGAFGEVRMCVHRDTGAQRAVKVLRKAHMDEDEKKMLFNEINILRNLVSRIILNLNIFSKWLHAYLLSHGLTEGMVPI